MRFEQRGPPLALPPVGKPGRSFDRLVGKKIHGINTRSEAENNRRASDLRSQAGRAKRERLQRLSSWNAFSVMASIVSPLHSYSTLQ